MPWGAKARGGGVRRPHGAVLLLEVGVGALPGLLHLWEGAAVPPWEAIPPSSNCSSREDLPANQEWHLSHNPGDGCSQLAAWARSMRWGGGQGVCREKALGP